MAILKTYYPLPKFPPISLSGTQCELQCRHCQGLYLKGMTSAVTAEALLRVGHTLQENGALGVLLSGGSNKQGEMLNLRSLLNAIRKMKEETGLMINIHPGLADEEIAQNLAVDFVSLEIPSNDTISDIFGLKATTEDYLETYKHLRNAGLNVVPHVCVYEGNEHELLEDIQALNRGTHAVFTPPEVIVVIVFSPTKHTPMAKEPPPAPEAVGHVVHKICEMFPSTEVSLGCMRPRDRNLRAAIEIAALEAGASRMVLPSKKTLQYARSQGYEITAFDACCALPRIYESLALRQ